MVHVVSVGWLYWINSSFYSNRICREVYKYLELKFGNRSVMKLNIRSDGADLIN